MNLKLLGLFVVSMSLLSCGVKKSKRYKFSKKYAQTVKGHIFEDLNQAVAASKQSGQEADPSLSWYQYDLERDQIPGISLQKAYQRISLKQYKQIIVAVIDSGVDINHDDLKDNIWVNKDEIPDNGIDDDDNGYIDDIHGWNFLGGVNGENIYAETLAETRVYKKLLEKKNRGELFTDYEEEIFSVVKKLVTTAAAKYSQQFKDIQNDLRMVEGHLNFLKIKLNGLSVHTRDDIEDIPDASENIQKIKNELLTIWDKYHRGFEDILPTLELTRYYLQVAHNPESSLRENIVGDDPYDFDDRFYGNNDVIGPDPRHGTIVAGVIAAHRKNNKGIKGVASRVKIMPIRIVPKGDERDKDVVMAIRYAVDNGAEIINMSFGKAFSLNKKEVDEALLYAAKNNVLVVHAAGNESKNINGGRNYFPNPYHQFDSYVLAHRLIPGFIEVGATTQYFDERLLAIFSNFGDDVVDLMAPGHRIYSTLPHNSYGFASGSSMATPLVSAVAAMIKSEYPNIHIEKLKNILLESSFVPANHEVIVPFSDDKLPWEYADFSTFSRTGGIVNAYEALKLTKEINKNN